MGLKKKKSEKPGGKEKVTNKRVFTLGFMKGGGSGGENGKKNGKRKWIPPPACRVRCRRKDRRERGSRDSKNQKKKQRS